MTGSGREMYQLCFHFLLTSVISSCIQIINIFTINYRKKGVMIVPRYSPCRNNWSSVMLRVYRSVYFLIGVRHIC